MTLDAAELEAAGLLDGLEGADARRERLRLLEQLVADGFSVTELQDRTLRRCSSE